MKVLISIIAFVFLFLIGISVVYPLKKNPRIRYQRYQEQYSHNLKNPFIEHYRKLSCDTSENVEVGNET